MKKLKKVLILLLIFAMVFTIYILNVNKKIDYIALGDSLAAGQNPYNQIGYGYPDYVANYLKENKLLKNYTKDYAQSGYRITDILKDIETNEKVTINDETKGIKEILREAELVTLSIGANDILSKLNTTSLEIDLEQIQLLNNYINETTNNLEELIKTVQKYFKNNLILVGYYNPLSAHSSEHCRVLEPLFTKMNNKMKTLAKKYDFYYVEIYEIFKENPEYLPNPKDIHPSNKGYQVIASSVIDVIEQNIIK